MVQFLNLGGIVPCVDTWGKTCDIWAKSGSCTQKWMQSDCCKSCKGNNTILHFGQDNHMVWHD